VENGQISPVYDPHTGLFVGYVKTKVSPDGLTIVNKTRPLHLLYSGQVERTGRREKDGSWSVTTRGIGNNLIPGMNKINEELGPGIFDALDQRLRDNIERHHGVRK
jgi:hypothetical protein